MTLDADVARLARVRPFSLMPREAVQLIAFSCVKQRLRAGEPLFSAGEAGDDGYFVQTGAILLEDKRAPSETARRATTGALIGESALYAPVVRRVDARAVEDTVRDAHPARDLPPGAGRVPRGGRESARGARRAHPRPGRRARRGARQIAGRRPAPAGAGHERRRGHFRTADAPPRLEDVEALADAAFARLPATFRRLCEGLVIQVVDFPDDETLDEMGAESEFDLLGLFRGRGLSDRGAVDETGRLPNMIWLYRRPLLDYWCDGEDTLGAVVTHVLVHEIGHHFGLSDADMEAIEQQAR